MIKGFKIKLYGGPLDGCEMEVDGHHEQWLFPRPTPYPLFKLEDGPITPEPMYVYVYKRKTFAYRYEFDGVRKQ